MRQGDTFMSESGNATRSRPPHLGSLSTLGVTWTPAPEARGYPLQPRARSPPVARPSSLSLQRPVRPAARRSRPRPSALSRYALAPLASPSGTTPRTEGVGSAETRPFGGPAKIPPLTLCFAAPLWERRWLLC